MVLFLDSPSAFRRDGVSVFFVIGGFAFGGEGGRRLHVREVGFVEAEVTAAEGVGARGRSGVGAFGGHFLAGFVVMPFFARFLPLDEGVDFVDGDVFVDLSHVDRTLEERVHIQLSALGPVSEELQDAFEPAHEGGKEAIVVNVHFVDKFVEVIFVAGAEVDEGLHGLVGVGGDVLALGAL